MRRITSDEIKDIQLFKYYKVVRKWTCANNDISDAELELLIYLSCLNRFTRDDFIKGTYIYSWDKKRWDRLRKQGWIDVWRHRNRTTIKYSVYKTSFKCNHMISRIYRLLLGEEDIPVSITNPYYKNKSYTDKVMNKVIDDMIKDKDR
jgi:hypothetical protein